MENVSVVLNLYLPQVKLLDRILDMLEKQTLKPFELVIVDKKNDALIQERIKQFQKRKNAISTRILKVNENLSFASSMNEGLRIARGAINVVLQQDCIPTSSEWLARLVSPFKDPHVLATVSKVTYPEELWALLDLPTQAIMLREKGTITPGLDEKACGYRKSYLERVGFFNEHGFQTAGEDYDMYIRLKHYGKIAYPDASILHYHPTNFESRIKKFFQYANGFGALVRTHGIYVPHWYVGFLKAIPLIGGAVFIASYPFDKGFSWYGAWFALIPRLHLIYVKGFWKGFISGKQSFDPGKS